MDEAQEQIIMALEKLSIRVGLLEEYARQHTLHYVKIRDELVVIKRSLGFINAWRDKVRKLNADTK